MARFDLVQAPVDDSRHRPRPRNGSAVAPLQPSEARADRLVATAAEKSVRELVDVEQDGEKPPIHNYPLNPNHAATDPNAAIRA